MRLPNAELAVVDLRKLRDYCLNRSHRKGKDKALVFESALGVTAADAEYLRTLILSGVLHSEAKPRHIDEFGRRYEVDVPMPGTSPTVFVRTGWIIGTNDDRPRLTSCYVLT